MKKPSSTGRARLVATALIVVAAGVFASVGMAGYGAKLVGLEHQSPTASQYPTSKVTICHHTHSQKNPFVTITVSQNAVAAHVRNHGDTVGPCTAQPPTAPAVPPGQAKKAAKVRMAHKAQHAAKTKLRLHGNANKAEHGSQGHAKAVGHESATVHGKGNAKGHDKTHGQSANHGQGQAKGHGHDKSQTTHGHGQGQGHGHDQSHGSQGQGHGQGNGDAHKSSGGGTGNGKGNGH
jgi:hypothetical protein